MEIFLIEDFLYLLVWCTLSCEYLREFLKKFETALVLQSGGLGKLIHVENLKSKARGTVL
jgi:hypothetical protein